MTEILIALVLAGAMLTGNIAALAVGLLAFAAWWVWVIRTRGGES